MSTATSGITSSIASSTNTSTSGLSGMSGEDFLTILVEQLQMQDPMNPMSNEDMVAQISSIRELEMNTRMSTRLEQLTEQQRFGSAAAIIGKHVTGKVTDANGNEYAMEGVVTGIRFTDDGEVMLELDTGETLPMTSLSKVTDAAGTTTTTGTSS